MDTPMVTVCGGTRLSAPWPPHGEIRTLWPVLVPRNVKPFRIRALMLTSMPSRHSRLGSIVRRLHLIVHLAEQRGIDVVEPEIGSRHPLAAANLWEP
jgi:hypothetical protein